MTGSIRECDLVSLDIGIIHIQCVNGIAAESDKIVYMMIMLDYVKKISTLPPMVIQQRILLNKNSV